MAQTLSGEPAVPGIIPGGVAPVQYQGGVAQTLSGEPAVPGIIPGGVAPQPPLGEATIPGMVSQISSVYSRSQLCFSCL